jgi:hypothetical protein
MILFFNEPDPAGMLNLTPQVSTNLTPQVYPTNLTPQVSAGLTPQVSSIDLSS